MTLDDVKRSLLLSKQSGLRICMDLDKVDGSECPGHRILPAIKEFVTRWKDLCISTLHPDSITAIRTILGPTVFSNVSSLHLRPHYSKGLEHVDSLLAGWTFPSLSCLEVECCIPPLRLVTRLTSLRVDYIRADELPSLVHVLQFASLLRDLEIQISRGGDQIGQDPVTCELPNLRRLHLDENPFGTGVVLRSAWLTRALKTPVLSSFTLRYISYYDHAPLDRNHPYLFPSDTDLSCVTDVRIHCLGSHASAEDGAALVGAVLGRLPGVKKLDLRLVEYAPLVHYVREYPSIRWLSLRLRHQNGPTLQDAEFEDLLKWLEHGDHEIRKFDLITWVWRSAELVKKCNKRVGNTVVRWDALVD